MGDGAFRHAAGSAPLELDRLWSARLRSLPASAIREICKLVDRPDVRSLAGGWPDPASFPAAEIRAVSAEILADRADRVLQYGATEGLQELRELLAERAAVEGLSLDADRILLTHGSQQAMDLAAGALLDPGDVVLVGLPTYFGGTGAFVAAGAAVEGVPVDDRGIDVDVLEVRMLA